MSSLQECVQQFLENIPSEHYPQTAVLGIAGPVSENRVRLTNIPGWPDLDGDELAKELKLKSFVFINDFTAAGYGISVLTSRDCDILGSSGEANMEEGAGSVKVVIGPGTGLGVGILVKAAADGLYEPYPSEGGHTDFIVKTEEDYKLHVFARNFIETSNNVENLRAKGKIGRISVERLCAGPAVPLIYAFMKEQYPDLE